MFRWNAPYGFISLFLVALLVASTPKAAWAMHPHVEFDELTHTADIIFAGTVTETRCRFGPNGSTIFTDVTFGDVRTIGRKSHLKSDTWNVVTLTFEGGQVGAAGLKVSGVPRLEVGQRVLLFALHDGREYSNPLVGGPQGLFHVVKDEATGAECVLTAGRSAVVSAANGRLNLGPPVSRVRNGRIEKASSPGDMAPDPVVVGGDGRATAARWERPVADTTLTLEDFANEIQATLARPAPANPVLGDFRKDLPPGKASGPRPGSQGPRHPAIQAAVKKESLGNRASQTPQTAAGSEDSSASTGLSGPPLDPITAGQSVGYCGYFDLPIVMEQVPTSWQSFDENDWAMIQWNRFMDVYRQRSDDGSFGSNYYSEFCGWLTDSEKRNAYGSGFGTAIAVCRTWYLWCWCCEIYEADIMFKAGLDWRYDMNEVLGQAGRILYRPVVMHELGHSWGLQRVTDEQYDYDIPTVMHHAYHEIVENGNGIHYYDAYAIRRVYDDQTSVINMNDVGIESYYASSGLKNATTNKGAYTSGESITISNITVENMSNNAAPNVDVKVYLSSIRNGKTWPMSGSLHWGSFPKESHWVGNITAVIPPNVPTYGSYYVTLEVTANNGDILWDDVHMSGNNTTSMYLPISVTCPPIGAPTGLTASDGAWPGSVVLGWNPVAGTQSYKVYRNTTNNSSTAQLIFSNIGVTSNLWDNNVVPGTTYYYWVTAVSPCGSQSGVSNAATGYAALTSPFATATDGDYYTHVHVSWPAVTGATHYRVYRSNTYDLAGASPITGWQAGLTFDDTPPTPAQDYYYWVSAAASSSGTHASSLVLERVGVGSLALPPPANVVATDDDETHPNWVTITWNSVPTATYYQVYRSIWDNPTTSSAISPWQTALSFNDSTAAAGPIYYYWVKACKNQYGVAATDYSLSDMGSRPAPPLPKPTGVAASDGTSPDYVTVTWSPVTGATHYRVWRGATIWPFFSSPVSGWITGTSYNHTTGSPGYTYYYWVTAASDSTGSQESDHGGYNTGWRALSPPSTITASDGASTTEIAVTWDEPLGASTYEVWRNTTNDPATATAVSGWLTEPVYSDTTAAQSTLYYYWVKAARSDNSRPSALSTTTDSGWRALPPGIKVAASDGTYADRVSVGWLAVPGAAAYRVYRNTADDPNTSQALSLWQSALSYNDTTAVIGQDYYYWVRSAASTKGQFPSDYGKSNMGWRPLPAPTGVAASDGTWGSSIRVTWNAVAGAAAYRVYGATVNDSASASPMSDWITVTAFTDDRAVVGQIRYYWVKAADDTSGGHASLFGNSDSGYRVLLPPTGVQASNGTYTDFIGITWNALPEATHYRVFREEDPQSIPISGWLTDLTFEDADTVPGVMYSYSVVAATGDQGQNQSAESSMDSGWRGLPPPENVAATDGGYPDRVQISWDAVAYANYYRVYRHTNPVAVNGIAVSGWQTATAFTDTSAVPNTVYYYWVRSDTDGTGQFASLFGIYDTGFAGADCNANGVPDATEPDTDGDGRIDGCDNCPAEPNANQNDADADLVGDICDECPGTVPGAIVDAVGCPGPIVGDFDRDGDVDDDDRIRFEACATGPGVSQLDPQCAGARLDADEDVDQSDFSRFQRCFSGEDVPANQNCGS